MVRRPFLILFFSMFSLAGYSQIRDLDFYLKEGIKNSPLLNDYMNQVSSARADSLITSAVKKPRVEAKSQLLYSPVYHNFGYDEVITDGGNYTAVLGVTRNIFTKRELDNKYAAIDLLRRSVINSSRLSTLELNKVITDQYLIAYSGFTDLLFNRTFLDLLEKENEIVKQFVKNGVGKQTDYLSLLVETQAQEILIKQLENQYTKDLMVLNQLCGLTDTSWYELTEPRLQITGNPDITKSPGFVQYKIDSLRLENEKTAIDIRYKPKVNLFADAGFLTSTPWNFYNHFGYSAGVSLNIPVYDGRQRDIEKQKLGFQENSRKAYENTYHNQYYSQVRQLKNELNILNEVSANITRQLKTSELLVKELKDQLEAGIIQMTEYLNAVKNFRTGKRSINLVNIQKLQVINEMNFLLTL